MSETEQFKKCTKCLLDCGVCNFQKYAKLKKDGTARYGSICVLCKSDYNNEYMRKKRQDPEFQAKEKAYLEARNNKLPRPKSIYK